MKYYNRILILAILFTLTALPANSTKIGYKYAGEFLNLGAGARATGIGNSFTALVDDATSSYWNPAGLAKLRMKEIHYMHSEQFGDLVNYDFIAYGVPLKGIGGISVSLVRLGIGNIVLTTLEDTSRMPGIDNVILPKQTITSSDYALLLSQGRLFPEYNLALGITVKLLRREIGDFFAQGIGFDIGLQYIIKELVKVGLTIKDFTRTSVNWENGTKDYIPPSLHFGLAYSRWYDLVQGKITLAAGSLFISELLGKKDYVSNKVGIRNDLILEPNASGALGLEYNLKDILFLRAGRNLKNATLGAGFKLKKFSFDYAYRHHSLFNKSDSGDLDDTHRVSGTIRY